MPGSGTGTFIDPDDYRASLRQARIDLLVTGISVTTGMILSAASDVTSNQYCGPKESRHYNSFCGPQIKYVINYATILVSHSFPISYSCEKQSKSEIDSYPK